MRLIFNPLNGAFEFVERRGQENVLYGLGGIPEAAANDVTYGRKNNAWVQIIDSDGYLHHSAIWHVYGGFQDQNETITIDAAETWTFITNATNDLWTGTEVDGFSLTDDVMTVENAGHYTGTVSITFEAGLTKDFHFRIYNITQDAQMGYVVGASGGGVNNYVNVVVPLFLECNANDQLRMEVACVTDDSNVTLKEAVFYISYLHD